MKSEEEKSRENHQTKMDRFRKGECLFYHCCILQEKDSDYCRGHIIAFSTGKWTKSLIGPDGNKFPSLPD